MTKIARRRADWSHLRVFFAVAETGGFNAAARELRLNPSTVTRTIDELERQLNVSLFIRGPRGVTLTQSGVTAYQRVRTMQQTAEALELEVSNAESLPEGRVKLAAPDGLAGFFISPHMPAFLRANPGIDLVVDCGLWPDRPLEGEADLTLTFSEPAYADAVGITIAHVHYALFASREYLDLYGAPSDGVEVLSHPYVHHVAQTHQKEIWGEKAIAFQTLTKKRIETNSSAVVVQAVKNGVGIGALPTAIMAVEPSLVMLDVNPLPAAKLWLVHHRDVGQSARIRAVVDWLKSIFDPERAPWYRREFVHPRDFPLAAPAAPAAPAAERPERKPKSA
ncbi:LysR family transcriptional regulator [Phenylobacterium sp.]|uniref:LysR family transcriptional regulator n=1 Tax=Phenylobacterium sp. TaxID=1871053 RepID=UPI0035B0FF4B